MDEVTRIGICDDESKLHDSIRAVIQRRLNDIEITSFFSTSTLKKHLKSGPYSLDILLLDVHFPEGESGLDALPAIREHGPGLQIVLLTAESNPDYIKFAFPYDVEYLPKPISEDVLLISLGNAVARFRMRTQEREHLITLREQLASLEEVRALKSVLDYTRFFENFLERRLGACGNGLIEKVKDVSSHLSSDTRADLIDVGRVRNLLVHEPSTQIKDLDQVLGRCKRIALEFRKHFAI